MANIANLLTEHMAIWTAADTEKKSGRGRASGNVGSVYGVKKLRELILELAVRGKLVPQDPNDEPASELLKRIQAEKTKLIAEGKLKKEKSIVSISEDEKPFELPKGWEWVHLPDVSDYKVGKTPSTKSSIYWTNDSNGYNWVSIADLNHDGVVTETSKKVTHEALNEVFRAEPVAVGTILMSFKLTLGKISILEVPAFHNEAIISIYPSPAIDKKYLFKILPARANEGDSKSAIKGNTLNSESIAALLLPLPPIAEQHRIVAKVDELMALCDQLEQQHSNALEAHETLVSQLLSTLNQSQNASEFNANWQRIYAHFDVLFTTEASIDTLKQTLLQLSVMGKLVQQDPNDEPASELLKRIQAENAKQVRNKKIRNAKVVIPSDMPSVNQNVPKGWALVRIADLLVNPSDDIVDGPFGSKLKASEYTAEGTPIIRIQNIDRGIFKENGIQFISEAKAKELKRHSFIYGDVVLNKLGEPAGKTCIVPESLKNGVIVADIIRIRLDETLHLKSYFVNCMNSPFVVKQFSELAKGVTRQRVNLSEVRSISMPLAPLAEQSRIVAKVDVLMALCDKLKTRIQHANQLQRSVADVLLESVVGTPKSSKVIVEKTDKIVMKIITTLRINVSVEFDSSAKLASIIKIAGGDLEAKSVWQASKLQLKDFYKQLKLEIDAGYILKPSAAISEEA